MRRAAALALALALGACTIHFHEAVPDEETAISTAVKLCGWQASPHIHAELKGERWHVWNDDGYEQAFLNRYDVHGTYFCVGL